MPDNVGTLVETLPQSPGLQTRPNWQVRLDDIDIIIKPTLPELTAKSYSELVQNFQEKPQPQGVRLEFQGEGLEDKDVYNPTAPIVYRGRRFLAARVESRASELNSQIMFFEETEKDKWRLIEESPTFGLQDPSLTIIEGENGGELILTGVEVAKREDGGTDYRTVFCRDYGQGLENLERFAEGPDRMKDIRPVQMQDGRICLFTRPQGKFNGENFGPGRICYTIINNINELQNPETYKKTKLIEGLFTEKEWGGVNAAYLLPNGDIGTICHIATFDENKDKYYAAASFCINPITEEITVPLKIIATAENAPDCPSKFDCLRSEVFPGGKEENEDGTIDIFCGKMDTASVRIPLSEHPFHKTPFPAFQAA